MNTASNAIGSLPNAVQPAAAIRANTKTRARIAAIDALRGLIIFIMLFDHVRENFFAHVPITDPLTVSGSEPMLFFTRIAAHFVAPLFVFLAGLAAWLYGHPASGEPRPVTGFLLKRGIFLILLEVTVVNLAWYGIFPPTILFLQVIWVIGLSMVALALLHRLPRWVLAAVAVALVFGHNLLTPIHFQPDEAGYGIWTILHDRGYLVAGGPFKIKVSYPLLPWIGVILLGYLAGPLFAKSFPANRRQRALIWLGVGSLALLAILRGFNIYGETLPWVHGENFVQTLMSWVNFTKYPPSLDFLLLTIGTGCLVLAWFELLDNWFMRVLVIFGSVPMFFYLFHLYLLLILQTVLVATVGPNHGLRFGVDQYWHIWVISFALIPVLYFPMRAFARFKHSSKQAWVRYF
jgi:uncharacterized membrane protein